MRAVVLVGGFGTRLRPLTLGTPKQMLPVVDRPMIEWVVGHLAEHGVDEAVLSLGYKPDAFTEAYPDATCAGVRLTYAVEDEPLDTAGAIRFAATEAGIDERFLVVNGDVLTDLDVGALVRFHDAHGGAGTLHLIPVEDPSRYGVVPTDADGRVQAFVEKPSRDEAPSHWINAGTYVLEPEVLDRIAPEGRVSVERETFPALAAEGTLYGYEAETYWVDAGTAADLPAGPARPGRRSPVGDAARHRRRCRRRRRGQGRPRRRHDRRRRSPTVRSSPTAPSCPVPGSRPGRPCGTRSSAPAPSSGPTPSSTAGRCWATGAVVEPGEVLTDARRPEGDS